MGLAPALGPWPPDKVFEEIRKTVRGYNVPLAGDRDRRRGADHAGERTRRRVESRPELIRSVAGHSVHFRHAGALFESSELRHGSTGRTVPANGHCSIVISLIKAALVAVVFMTTLAYLQWVERKVIAHIQLRLGPYRVGPHGLLQPLADVIKLITKEDLIPPHVNKFFYLLAPFLAVTMALISISVIPFGAEDRTSSASTRTCSSPI